jgi:hypothetical protein
LLVQGHLLRLELVRGRLELGLFLRVCSRLPLKLPLLALQASLLLLQLLLLRGELPPLGVERVCLRRELFLLALPLLLLLLELLLQALRLSCWLVYSLLGFGGVPSLTATSSGPL